MACKPTVIICTQNVHDILAKLLHDVYVHCVWTCDNLVKLLYIQCINIVYCYALCLRTCVCQCVGGGWVGTRLCVCVCVCMWVCDNQEVVNPKYVATIYYQGLIGVYKPLLYIIQYTSLIICMCGIVSFSNHCMYMVSILHWGFCLWSIILL